LTSWRRRNGRNRNGKDEKKEVAKSTGATKEKAKVGSSHRLGDEGDERKRSRWTTATGLTRAKEDDGEHTGGRGGSTTTGSTKKLNRVETRGLPTEAPPKPEHEDNGQQTR
jgi:hypothetical protein